MLPERVVELRADGTRAPARPAHVEPLRGQEEEDLRRSTVTSYRVFLDADRPPAPSSRLEWRGLSYSVQGAPAVHTARGRVRYHTLIMERRG